MVILAQQFLIFVLCFFWTVSINHCIKCIQMEHQLVDLMVSCHYSQLIPPKLYLFYTAQTGKNMTKLKITHKSTHLLILIRILYINSFQFHIPQSLQHRYNNQLLTITNKFFFILILTTCPFPVHFLYFHKLLNLIQISLNLYPLIKFNNIIMIGNIIAKLQNMQQYNNTRQFLQLFCMDWVEIG